MNDFHIYRPTLFICKINILEYIPITVLGLALICKISCHGQGFHLFWSLNLFLAEKAHISASQ